MVCRCISSSKGTFSGAMLVSGSAPISRETNLMHMYGSLERLLRKIVHEVRVGNIMTPVVGDII